jgi:hypothetical protein
VELACYKFEPPVGVTHTEVLLEAHKLRVSRDDYAISDEHVADALEVLTTRTTRTLSEDRTPKNPYAYQNEEGYDRHLEGVNRGARFPNK